MRVTFGEYVFTDAGRAHVGRTTRYERPEKSTRMLREVVSYSVTEWFLESTFADNQARFTELKAALAAGEGTLHIEDENGVLLFDGLATVESTDMPEQWGQHVLEVRVQFRVVTAGVAAVDALNATYSANSEIVTLPNVMTWKEDVKTDRYSTAVSNRKETMVRITASGRVYADVTLPESDRRDYLLGQKTAIESCADSQEGVLFFAGVSATVQVEQITCDIGDGSEYAEWSLQAFYRRFPGDDYAETEYDVSIKENREQAERVYTVRGEVRADDKAGALAAAQEIRGRFSGSGRIQQTDETSEKWIDGADGAAFLTLQFSYEFRERMDILSWTLQVSTRMEAKADGLVTVYSGTVKAGSSASALSKARALGMGKGSFMLQSSEVLATMGQGSAEQFMECSYSYEYQGKAGLTYAEVASAIEVNNFGDNSETVSGFVAADTESMALAAARAFKLNGRLMRSSRENPTKMQMGSGALHSRLDFSYSYYLGHSAVSLKYGKESEKDWSTLTETINVAGEAWASSEASATAAINSLIASLPGKRVKDSTRTQVESAGGVDGFLVVSFSASFTRRIQNVAGGTILEAEVGVEYTLSRQKGVMTFIPYGTPYMELNVGMLPATAAVSGYCVAASESDAKSWGRGKRSMGPGGGFEEQPRERITHAYMAMSGTEVRAYRMDFTYAFTVANLQNW